MANPEVGDTRSEERILFRSFPKFSFSINTKQYFIKNYEESCTTKNIFTCRCRRSFLDRLYSIYLTHYIYNVNVYIYIMYLYDTYTHISICYISPIFYLYVYDRPPIISFIITIFIIIYITIIIFSSSYI